MNGRIYDPRLARFLSPDPYVQAPDFTQSFNRYSYVWNNPLKYTDPDGEWVHLLVGALIGGTINWIAHGAEFSWEGLGYFGVGALAGSLSAGIGAGVSSALVAGGSFTGGFIGTSVIQTGTGLISGALSGGAAGFTNGFVTGVGNALINNESGVFKMGLIDGFNQGLSGIAAGAILGSIDAVLNDRHFLTGSDKKQYYVFDGEKYINVNDWNRSPSATKGKYLIDLNATDEPFQIFIKTPRGFKPNGYATYSESGGWGIFDRIIQKNNTLFDFHLVDGKMGIGALISRRTQVIDKSNLFNMQLIHPINREYSNLFFWLFTIKP
jgi:hypothetical protein